MNTFVIFKINDMELLGNAYMNKGAIHHGEEEAVTVTFTIFLTNCL